MSTRQTIVDGAKWCDYHGVMEPLEDFATRGRSEDGSVLRYAPRCRLAEQTIRDANKNNDPALFAVIGRAKDFAGDASKAVGCTISYHFVLTELLWVAFVPYLRAAIGPGGMCLNCGKHWDDPRQYHLEHRFPARTITDWACQHARNRWLACPGCNCGKGTRDGDRSWIEQEHREWMLDRDWAGQAGSPGWPPYEPAFGAIPITLASTTESSSGLVFASDSLFGGWQ